MNSAVTKSSDGMGSALLSLLTSSTTLLCCALPALLVALGAGAVLSSLVGAVPQLVIFSEYKAIVFGFAFVMLAVNGVLLWRNRNAPCPIGLNALQAQNCMRTRKYSARIYLLSLGLFLIGSGFALCAPG